MRDTKLILVEGMPGTGKLTVSQFIHLQLQANGRDSNWVHEESAVHPVCLYFDRDRHDSWSDYSEDVASRWQSYARELHGLDQVAVLDAAVLQNHVRSMLIFNCDRNVILELVCRIEDLIAFLNPAFVYLRPTDVERNFRDVVAVRGSRMLELWIEAHNDYPYTLKAQAGGYSGFIAFWREFGEISDRVFDGLTISRLRQNVPTDRGAQAARIVDFLGLDSPADDFPPPIFERFIGEYVPMGDETGSGFELTTEDGCLVAVVDQPTIDTEAGPIGCFREVLLIPNGVNRFHVAAWPHEVEFTEDESGRIVSMRVSVSAEGWVPGSRIYLKRGGAAGG